MFTCSSFLISSLVTTQHFWTLLWSGSYFIRQRLCGLKQPKQQLWKICFPQGMVRWWKKTLMMKYGWEHAGSEWKEWVTPLLGNHWSLKLMVMLGPTNNVTVISFCSRLYKFLQSGFHCFHWNELKPTAAWKVRNHIKNLKKITGKCVALQHRRLVTTCINSG